MYAFIVNYIGSRTKGIGLEGGRVNFGFLSNVPNI